MEEKINKILWDFAQGKLTHDEATQQVLDLFAVMHRSFQGTNRYAIEHLINDTYQVVDKIDDTVYHQGTKRDCEVYLYGA